jgi:hypothetical protein
MTFKKMNAIWAGPPIAGLGGRCPNGCMSPGGISQLIREGSLSDVASDIPAGVTLAEYAAARRRKAGGRRRTRVTSFLLARRTR